jgi:RNA polymerase primary sigma factor
MPKKKKKRTTKKGGKKTLKKLMSAGKKKGYLTYQQVNDILPEDIVSSEEIDEIFTLLGEEDIQIVDKEGAKKLEKEKARQREEDKKGKRPTALPRLPHLEDPVRMYLREMGQISLLSRQEEIRLAEEIENTAEKFKEALYQAKLAKKEILDIANKILRGEVNPEDFLDCEGDIKLKKYYNKLQTLTRRLRATKKRENIPSI